ncbi:hypothetical protein PRIPAC_77174 [Pristionchus pacificus]|uniref:Uncharacterized protein n=1 Tax=Pristionchus pacificus TaxID=54126 RepID=A0A2A6C4C6_PRIPA|nr:hypothetical protein PRIPAC_77174 [Pristionchus pacificus]|eukprot:PDM73014.1 hypothetical protein PRIPAC_39448 [Pristionchus pacificus]
MSPLFLATILFTATVVDSTRTVLVGIRARSALQAALLRELLMQGIVHDTEIESAYHPVSPMKQGNLNRIAQMGARGFGRRR